MSEKLMQASVPTTVTGLTFWGYPLADWVLVATLLYTCLLIVNNAMTLWQKLKGWCRDRARKE